MSKSSETATEAILRLQAALEEAKHPDYVKLVFQPVTPSEIEQAQNQLAVVLPPCYVEIVTRLGAFKVAGPSKRWSYDKIHPFYHPLLSPAEMVQHTLKARSAYEKVDPRTAEMLRDSLLFQGNIYFDNFYTFRISSRREDGEMSVHSFYHDDSYEWSGGEFWDFTSHMRDFVENRIAELK